MQPNPRLETSYGPTFREGILGTSRSASRCFDRGDVDLFHFHHRLERALRGRTIRIGRCFQQYSWGDLPGQAPFVLAPSACALGAAIADDGIPVAIGLGLVLGNDLKRKGLIVLESRAAIQADAGDAHHRKLDREYVALFAIRVVAGGMMNRCHGTVRKSPGVEPGGFFCCAVIQKTNHVLGQRPSPFIRQLSESTMWPSI